MTLSDLEGNFSKWNLQIKEYYLTTAYYNDWQLCLTCRAYCDIGFEKLFKVTGGHVRCYTIYDKRF